MIHPLQPLPPLMRLGWLEHFTTIRCRKSIHQPGSDHSSFVIFAAGKRYPLTTETVRVSHTGRRARRDGITEPVTFNGWDLLVKVKAENGDWHRFIGDPQTNYALIHDFTFLVDHFDIPEIPDVGALYPKQLAEYRRRLKALEI